MACCQMDQHSSLHRPDIVRAKTNLSPQGGRSRDFPHFHPYSSGSTTVTFCHRNGVNAACWFLLAKLYFLNSAF
ncbi:hypothetical protein GDO78_015628 [Eleutherodactylus coqui]|uniref:Uncharacterized protein n=1 Tax=Eleutherodactylus coqui TaxID=57060 RepID=A0A8J6EDJ6_ELECQ|nr:hypothetical protein GDO78_015628 [Eleutherodactylus coqui]